ncbi:TonB-dependent receptor [Paraferrimonas sedimenticola]|uniref:TonB-dependent receptor n=1 Tax=Paraferrimonas sedimenticola TaxID=375674 RepID=A0AA37RWZ8_9GAMM|nr:TonB-dependent receptor [Paraferrimonas sedimenticola]GLP96859.1 TonB-dependent receptor [Paraferrimonas sedimenticola]
MKQGQNSGAMPLNSLAFAVAAALSLGASPVAFADEAEETKGIEVIEVTAQKRAQSIQEVPIAISAFSNDDIVKLGANNINDLGPATPGMESNNLSVTQPRYTIRGIRTADFGIGSDPAVAVYVDGVYTGRSGSAQLNFNDIERVEILKGPQGTLFGRNAVAGAIHVITKKPMTADNEGNFKVTLGNYNRTKGEGMFNFGISETVGLRLSALIDKSDGYVDRAGGGDALGKEDTRSVRGALLWTPSAATEVIFRAEFDKVDRYGTIIASRNAAIAPADPFGPVATDADGNEMRDLFGTSLEVNHEMESMTFTSITSYRQFDANNLQDDDGSADPRFYFATDNREDNKVFSQEFRLTSNTDGKLDWVTGVNFSHEKAKQQHDVILTGATVDTFILHDSGIPGEMIPNIPAGAGWMGLVGSELGPALPVISEALGYADPNLLLMEIAALNYGKPWLEQTFDEGTFTSAAIFGDLIYSVTDRLDLTFGARYTYDKKDFQIWSQYQNEITFTPGMNAIGIPNVPFGLAFFDQFNGEKQSDSWSKLTPRAVVNFKATDDAMLYASIAQGFKAGGFNSLGQDPAFEPETVWNYEAGWKTSWLDNDIRFNGSVFFWDYKDLQTFKLSGPSGAVPTYNVRNADAEGKGFELEFNWAVTQNFNLLANYGYVDTKYTRYDLFPGEGPEDDITGLPLSSMPKNKVYAAADYNLPLGETGDLAFRFDYSWVDDRVDSSGAGPADRIKAYSISNARITYMPYSGDWQLAAYANNVFDEKYLIGIGGQGAVIGSPTTRRGLPRTMGVEFSLLF